MSGPSAAHIRSIAERKVSSSPAGELLRDARTREPVLVRTPDGDPAYWLVPFLRGTACCGFASLTLAGAVQRVGTFGSGPEDRGAWIPATFFDAPPPGLVDEIRAQHGGGAFSEPIFSYDVSPLRWGWRLRPERSPGDSVFIGPSGGYVVSGRSGRG